MAWGRLLLLSSNASCAQLPKDNKIQRAAQTNDQNSLSLLKITQFLLSGLNVFKTKEEIFACVCLEDAK